MHTIYECNDGNFGLRIGASSEEEAADAFVSKGTWEDTHKTYWVNVTVTSAEEDDSCSFAVAVEPIEPDCQQPRGHYWQHSEVVGHGGGVVETATCPHCGLVRHTDTWATNLGTGEQGFTSVEYLRGT